MYLQKCAQYAGGEYVDADLDGNLYKWRCGVYDELIKDFLSLVAKASSEKS